MTLPRTAIIYRPGGAANLQDIHHAALGICEPVILIDATVADANPSLLTAARNAMLTKVLDPGTGANGVVRLCHDLRIRALTTFHDLDLDLCDAAAALLGLPGASGIDAPWDKLNQRDRIPPRFSVPAVPVDSAAELRPAVKKIGFPAVLKPRRATGGSGLAFISEPDDIAHQESTRRHWSGLLLESCFETLPHPSQVPYLAGFVSVETVNTGEARHHVAVFDKIPVVVERRTGTEGTDSVWVAGDVFPSRLTAPHLDHVVDAVDQSLAALGARWRVTHTEVALTAHGPVIIEVNGRVGGHLNRLLRLTEATDLVRAALECAMAQPPSALPRPASRPVLGYYPPFADPTGSVRSHVTLRDIRKLPGVRGVSTLARHGASRTATDFRMVNLTATADHADQLDVHFAAIREGVETLFRADSPGRSAHR